MRTGILVRRAFRSMVSLPSATDSGQERLGSLPAAPFGGVQAGRLLGRAPDGPIMPATQFDRHRGTDFPRHGGSTTVVAVSQSRRISVRACVPPALVATNRLPCALCVPNDSF